MNSYVRYSGIGFQMIVVIGLFAFLGHYLDERNHSETPLYTAFLTLLGVCIAMYLVIRSLKNLKS